MCNFMSYALQIFAAANENVEKFMRILVSSTLHDEIKLI